MAKLTQDISLDNTYSFYSTGYTLGFWFFSNNKDLGTNVLRVTYEDNFMIAITTDTDLFGHCFIGLESFDILGKTDTAANLKTLISSSDDSNNLNFKKTSAKIDEGKWRYIRCAYSYSLMKYYLEVNGAGFPAAKATTNILKMPPYFANTVLKLPPRRFYPTAPKLTISRLTGLSADKYVFIRNIALFADYIHPNIYLHYM